MQTKSIENLTIDYEVQEGTLCCTLTGRVDANTSPILEEVLVKNSFEKAFIDASKMPYISSAGLRCLLLAAKKAKEGVTITKTSATVKEIFEVTGFDTILNIE